MIRALLCALGWHKWQHGDWWRVCVYCRKPEETAEPLTTGRDKPYR